jgi:hypothetical protein
MLSKHCSTVSAAGRFALVALVLLLAAAAPVAAQLGQATAACAFFGRGYSDLYHGFYVTNYAGNNLSTVTLAYTATTAGQWFITLTAHRNSFDGPMIGATQTATVDLVTTGETRVIFDFGAAPVTPGDTIAFTQTGGQITSLSNEFGSVEFDAGLGSSGTCDGIFETNGTAAPLDTVLQPTVGILITQASSPNGITLPCVPSDTVICLDDYPGDRRFKVTANFQTVQGTVHSGAAQATPLSSLGTAHGGLLWFFDPATPEVLVKVLNGCAINNHYWVFFSAVTNVGFSLTVDDTARVGTRTYTNPDLTAAVPVQDTSALADCGGCTSNSQCPTGLLCCFLPAGSMQCIQPTSTGVCPAYP